MGNNCICFNKKIIKNFNDMSIFDYTNIRKLLLYDFINKMNILNNKIQISFFGYFNKLYSNYMFFKYNDYDNDITYIIYYDMFINILKNILDDQKNNYLIFKLNKIEIKIIFHI